MINPGRWPGLTYPAPSGLRADGEQLDRLRPAFTRSDADAIGEGEDEDFAIANAAFGTGAAGFHDGFDSRFDEVFIDGDLQLYLTGEGDVEGVATVPQDFLPRDSSWEFRMTTKPHV